MRQGHSRVTLSRPMVVEALERISPYVHKTPVLTSSSIDAIASASIAPNGDPQASDCLQILFKCENYQKVGAFKARGAFNSVMSLSSDLAQKGVCTHSSGNHAQALAFAAKTRGIPAYVVMPHISTPSKIAATKSYGAMVRFSGSTSAERESVLIDVQNNTGATFIPPYDYEDTILGQGTTAIEFEQQARDLLKECEEAEDLDAMISPLGGGGLLGGIAIAVADQIWNGHPSLVYGAEPSFGGADDACRGLAKTPPARIGHVNSLTIADGLRTPVGKLNWDIISDTSKVSGVYSVSEEEIKKALRLLLERLKTFVEPSAAVSFAVVLFNEEFKRECRLKMKQYGKKTWRVGVILTGGNTTVEAIAKLYQNVNLE